MLVNSSLRILSLQFCLYHKGHQEKIGLKRWRWSFGLVSVYIWIFGLKNKKMSKHFFFKFLNCLKLSTMNETLSFLPVKINVLKITYLQLKIWKKKKHPIKSYTVCLIHSYFPTNKLLLLNISSCGILPIFLYQIL